MGYQLTEATQSEFFTLRLGEQGWRVLACQVALNSRSPSPNLALDGFAGRLTIAAVKSLQAAIGIIQDGIAGPETQEHFTKVKCRHGELHMTPPGLLAGICNIESSYQWACVSPLNDNNTVDCGVAQESIPWPASEARLRLAFNPESACHVLAAETRGAYKAFAPLVSTRRAWELAALNHNWPAAAEALADGNAAWVDKPFAFTTAKGYATGLAYADHYIAVATGQVTTWAVA